MLKKIIPLAAALALSPGLASANGVITAAAPFELLRAGTDSFASMASNSLVRVGDVVRSTQGAFQLDFLGGNAVLVDKNAQIAMTGAESLTLEKGSVIAGSRGAGDLSVAFQELLITPGTAGATGTVFVGEMPSGALQVSVFDGAFNVLNSATESGLAFLGSGDSMLFVPGEGGSWVATVPVIGAAFAGLELIQGGVLTPDAEFLPFFWWVDTAGWIIGGAFVGLGSWFVYDQYIRDDNDDDRRRVVADTPRTEFSPILRPQDEDQ
jgi:hypothetical protein